MHAEHTWQAAAHSLGSHVPRPCLMGCSRGRRKNLRLLRRPARMDPQAAQACNHPTPPHHLRSGADGRQVIGIQAQRRELRIHVHHLVALLETASAPTQQPFPRWRGRLRAGRPSAAAPRAASGAEPCRACAPAARCAVSAGASLDWAAATGWASCVGGPVSGKKERKIYAR
jgi:hypothetical protein